MRHRSLFFSRMTPLYPPIAPYRVHHMPVDPPHTLYVEECGRPDGVPVVFLHGGPGSGCRPDHCRYFAPDFYRVLLFDQRGCGRSMPAGTTAGNRTEDLVADMEAIRRALGIAKWLVFGGSWGAALALCYAQRHPERLLGLVLRGTFLARARDLQWVFGPDGAARLLPRHWERFLARLPPEERQDPVTAYHRRIHAGETGDALKYARAWRAWEDRVATWTLAQPPSGDERPADGQGLLAQARIATHYARNAYFLKENQLLDGASLLPQVPIVIVHGRRDLVCTMEAAWGLHGCVPWSRLAVVPEAGHLASEPAMIDALVSETDRLRGLLSLTAETQSARRRTEG
jgi:proline iminopeptidase